MAWPKGRPSWNKGLTAADNASLAAQSRKMIAKGKASGRPFVKGDGVASRLRRAQLEHEERQAKELVDNGFEVFSPTVVCDRVAVKDGKVYFVEFKRPGQKLRPGQQRVQELVPQMYMVKYSE